MGRKDKIYKTVDLGPSSKSSMSGLKKLDNCGGQCGMKKKVHF
jgi:hypothetical protein